MGSHNFPTNPPIFKQNAPIKPRWIYKNISSLWQFSKVEIFPWNWDFKFSHCWKWHQRLLLLPRVCTLLLSTITNYSYLRTFLKLFCFFGYLLGRKTIETYPFINLCNNETPLSALLANINDSIQWDWFCKRWDHFRILSKQMQLWHRYGWQVDHRLYGGWVWLCACDRYSLRNQKTHLQKQWITVSTSSKFVISIY